MSDNVESFAVRLTVEQMERKFAEMEADIAALTQTLQETAAGYALQKERAERLGLRVREAVGAQRRAEAALEQIRTETPEAVVTVRNLKAQLDTMTAHADEMHDLIPAVEARVAELEGENQILGGVIGTQAGLIARLRREEAASDRRPAWVRRLHDIVETISTAGLNRHRSDPAYKVGEKDKE